MIKENDNEMRIGSDGVVDVVDLKLPIEMFGSFGAADGVYLAYHMNKPHWITSIREETSPSYLPRKRKLSRDFAGKQKKNGNLTIPVFLV